MSKPHQKPVPTDASPSAPKRRQSKRGLETERKLIAVADHVFWVNGYSGATIMQIMQTEFGMGLSLPQGLDTYAQTIARVCCGILGSTGQTETPSVTIIAG